MVQLAKKWKICFCEMTCSNVCMKLQLYDSDAYLEEDWIKRNPKHFTPGGDISINRTFDVNGIQEPDNSGTIDTAEFGDDWMTVAADADHPLEITYSYESEVSIEAIKCAFKTCLTRICLPDRVKVSYSLDDGVTWNPFQDISLQSKLKEFETNDPGSFVVFELINAVPEQQWTWTYVKQFRP
jgi:hypothetical protein